MMKMRFSSRMDMLSLSGALLLVAGLVFSALPVSGLESSAPERALSLEPILSLDLHGSSPTMAWSPGSRRIVINSVFNSWETPKDPTIQKAMGIHVVDVVSGAKRQLSELPGFHPFWLGDEAVGWVRSVYMNKPSGLFVMPIRSGAKHAKLGKFDNPHRSYLAKNGKILAFIDGGESYGWNYVDPRNGKTAAAVAGKHDNASGSWDTPHSLISSQCLQRVGQVAVSIDPRNNYVLEIGGRSYELAKLAPFIYEHEYGPKKGNGPLAPCLSPDGRHLALIAARDSKHAYGLRVFQVPSSQQAVAKSVPVERAQAGGLKVEASLLLHGSTPSMSWSPDGRRVVANNAFEYYGFDDRIKNLRKKLGIYVLDAQTGNVTHVSSEQGYHPFWFSNSTVGWGHSEYEYGNPGIYSAPVKARAMVRRIGKVKGVHRTLLAKNGQVLAFIGFPEYKNWCLVDTDTGTLEQFSELESLGSWDDPAGHYRDQCLQQVGDVGLERDAQHGLILRSGGRVHALSNDPIFGFKGDYGRAKKGKAVSACLSPNGSQVAFFAQTRGLAGYNLIIARVPR